MWKLADHSLHLRPPTELIPCTKPHWISQILHHPSWVHSKKDIFATMRILTVKKTCYKFSTQPEHAENWFHTKRSNGLRDIPFTSQATYTVSELVLYKENNYLLKECVTQTHVWKPGDHSLHLIPLGELIPCTKPLWISQILHHPT